MFSQIARKLDSLATVNPLVVMVVNTEGCAKTATESILACISESTLCPTINISYTTHKTDNILHRVELHYSIRLS